MAAAFVFVAQDCNTPCPANPSLMCGGSSRIEIYMLECSASWGGPFLLTVFICALLYLVGFTGFNIKFRGATPSLQALPHKEFWTGTKALVVDGVRFSFAHAQIAVAKARGKEYTGWSYTRIPEPEPVAAAGKQQTTPGNKTSRLRADFDIGHAGEQTRRLLKFRARNLLVSVSGFDTHGASQPLWTQACPR